MPTDAGPDPADEYKALLREVVEAVTESSHVIADAKPHLAELAAQKTRANDLEEKRQKQFGVVLDSPALRQLLTVATTSLGTLFAAAAVYYSLHWFGVSVSMSGNPSGGGGASPIAVSSQVQGSTP